LQELYTNPKSGLKIFTSVPLPKKKGEYLYFIRIGQKCVRLHKIGTTNDMFDRMKEHLRNYKENIFILWISPSYSKWTTVRVEDRQKKWWIEHTNWQYLRQDRFIIPPGVKEITITVRKEWHIPLEE
jgi:hypothetical protein